MTDKRKEEHVELPLKDYMIVRPEIEQLVITLGRPMTYHEVKDHLFDVLGTRRVPSSAQLASHVARSKKLKSFRYKDNTYVVSKKDLEKFLRSGVPE
jgi:hypothetical protein